MSSSIVVPDAALIGATSPQVNTERVQQSGDYAGRIATALITVATAAQNDINTLQVSYLRPVDGVSDDAPQIAAALLRMDGIGPVVLLPGANGENFQILSSAIWAARSPHLVISANVVAGLPLDNSNSHVIFWVSHTTDSSVAATTLSANATMPSQSMSLTGYVAANKWVRVDNIDGDSSQIFQVTATTITGTVNLTTLVGSDTNTLTLISGAKTITFVSPSNATAILSQINAVFPGTATMDGSSHLVLTGLQITGGTARTVLGIASSAYKIAVDVPVEYLFLTGATVGGVFPAINPIIEGDGLISGTTSEVVNVTGAIGGRVSVRFNGLADWGGVAIDIGSRNTQLVDWDITNPAGNGVSADGTVGVTIARGRGRNLGGCAVGFNSSRRPVVSDIQADGGTLGARFGSLIGGGAGTWDAIADKCVFTGQSVAGVNVSDTSRNINVSNIKVVGADVGFEVSSGCARIAFSKCRAVSCTTHSWYILGCRSVSMLQCFDASSGSLTLRSSTLALSTFYGRDSTGIHQIEILNDSILIAKGLDLGVTRAGSWYGVYMDMPDSGSPHLSIDGAYFYGKSGEINYAIVMNTSSTAVADLVAGCVCDANMANGFADNPGCKTTFGTGNIMPITITGTANRGTFTLNGVAQVDVTGYFPVDARISMSLKTVGTTPGLVSPYFSAAQTANVFHVKSATALANDVYNWFALS